MSKKKILVTGSSGYLGSNLCHALLKQGYSVRAFVRATSSLTTLPSSQTPDFDTAFGDVTDFPSLLSAASGCHFIIHSAALVEPWLPNPSLFSAVNVGGLKNVIQVCKETKSIEKIVYTSSFFALGPTDGGFVAEENQIHPEKYFCTEYERSKVAADKIALQAASEGVPIVPVYPGVIYGSGKLTTGNIVAKLLIERFNWRLPGYIGQGNDRYSFSHIDDVVEGHIAAIVKGRPGERYLLTGENASFKYVFDAAAILTNTSKPRFSIPLFVIEAYGWVSVLFSRITGKLPLISPPGLPSTFCRSSLPRNDGMVTLVDEKGEEFPTVYLQRKRGLSGGWKGFAQFHDLVDGDTVIFQVIKPTVLKVYIIRASGLETSGLESSED